MIKYGVYYGVYLNQLIFPMKFFELDKLARIPEIDHSLPVYLIYKKCNYEVKELFNIVRKYYNIFKIEVGWNDFKKSLIYRDLINIVKNCNNRS
jgi:hypothetical protein